jgi:hypothetical protein
MAAGVIEPSAVISPSRTVEPIQTGRQRFYDTYNTRDVPLGGDTAVGRQGPAVRIVNITARFPGGGQPAPTPKGVPSFLGSRSIILFAWGAAMAMVSLDEWHAYHILPRPARLWDTTLTYFLLAAVSTFDPLTPICTLIAVGLTIAVAYNYYQGAGGFGGFGAAEAQAAAKPGA